MTLTVRETEVLAGAATGRTQREVAAVLGMSLFTVKDRLKSARRKLGQPSTALAAVAAARAGYLSADVERVLPGSPNPHSAGVSRRCGHCNPMRRQG